MEHLLRLRGLVGQEIERARQEKRIGNALETYVTLTLADAGFRASLTGREAELAEFLIVSDVSLAAGEADAASLTRTANARCERCWRHRPTVGRSATFPKLCDRCEEVVGGGRAGYP